jgi:hypothetical protein
MIHGRPISAYATGNRFMLFLSAVLIPILLFSCDNSFTAKEPFVRRVVVFAVLDKSASFQSVRLEATYDAAFTSPDEPLNRMEITDATVTIRSDRQLFQLYDTLITQSDGTKKKIWITRALRPQDGAAYYLSVKVPGFDEIKANTNVPGQAYLQMEQTQLGPNVEGVTLYAGAISASMPKGYLFRLWIAGEKEVGGNIVERRFEIPSGFDNTTGKYIYPAPSRDQSVFFPMANIVAVREKVIMGDTLMSLRLIAQGYTFDTFLYSYYKITRGFEDPVSVRQDSPDVTNIINGVGIFGALVTDSIRAKYSDIISK